MRILFVAPWLPGVFRPRPFQILRHLSAHHEVWLAALYDDNEDTKSFRGIDLAGTTLITASRSASIRRALRSLPSRRSLQESYVGEPKMQAAVADVIRSWAPDVVHMNVVRSRTYLPTDYAGHVLFDLDEIRSDFYAQLANGRFGAARRLLGRIEAPRMRRAEVAAVTRSDLVFFSSPTDLGRIATGRDRLIRTPQLVRPVEYLPLTDRILFVGRMCYGANIDAAVHFARKVFPRILERVPTAHLDIVGERPTRRVRSLQGESISVHGAVDDLGPFYAHAGVAVMPVDAATGVQMKLIQALALGVPSVSTPLGALRAGLQSGTHLLTAASDLEWANAVSTLIEDRALADALAGRAKAWAAEVYSETALSAGVDAAYASLRSPRA